jgi:hypothetical protein
MRRRPITTIILSKIAALLTLSTHDERCYWAAACVAVYCLLRSGEFLEESRGRLLRKSHLSFMDAQRSSACLTLKNTKSEVWDNDRFAYFFRNGSPSCPAFAVTHYLDNCPDDLAHNDSDPSSC